MIFMFAFVKHLNNVSADEYEHGCCPKIIVPNLGLDYGGVYTFVRFDQNIDFSCLDGCVYNKDGDGDEFCFIEDQENIGLQTFCDVVSTTSSSTFSTSVASQETPTSSVPPLDVIQKEVQEKVEEKITHEKNLTETDGERLKAENLTNHLDDTRKKITEIVIDTTRQISDCSDIIIHVTQIDEAVTKEKFAEASALALEIIQSEASCNADEKDQLKLQQEIVKETKAKLESIIRKKEEEILELKVKINGLIEDLQALNEILTIYSITTIDYGTEHNLEISILTTNKLTTTSMAIASDEPKTTTTTLASPTKDKPVMTSNNPTTTTTLVTTTTNETTTTTDRSTKSTLVITKTTNSSTTSTTITLSITTTSNSTIKFMPTTTTNSLKTTTTLITNDPTTTTATKPTTNSPTYTSTSTTIVKPTKSTTQTTSTTIIPTSAKAITTVNGLKTATATMAMSTSTRPTATSTSDKPTTTPATTSKKQITPSVTNLTLLSTTTKLFTTSSMSSQIIFTAIVDIKSTPFKIN